MQEVIPVKDAQALEQLADNGGWLYNLLSRPMDGEITTGELARAAGAYILGPLEILFWEMLQFELSQEVQEAVSRKFERPLQEAAVRWRPKRLKPSMFSKVHTLGQSAIVEGYPRFHMRWDARGASAAPLSPGSAAHAWSDPEDGVLDILELYEGPMHMGTPARVVVPAGWPIPPSAQVRFGGIISAAESPDMSEVFLEAQLFTKLAGARPRLPWESAF